MLSCGWSGYESVTELQRPCTFGVEFSSRGGFLIYVERQWFWCGCWVMILVIFPIKVCISRSWPLAGGHQSLQFIPGTAFQASSQLERGLCYTRFRHPGKHLGMDVCISVHIDSQGLSSLSPPESRDWDKDLHKDGLLKHWPKKQEWIQESQWEDVLLRWPCGQLSASRNVCTGHAEGHISPPALAKVALRAPLICISWVHLCVLRPTSGPQRSSRIEKMGVRHG